MPHIYLPDAVAQYIARFTEAEQTQERACIEGDEDARRHAEIVKHSTAVTIARAVRTELAIAAEHPAHEADGEAA